MSTFRRGWRWFPPQGNLWFVEDNLSSRKPMRTVPELSHDLNVEHMMLELLVLNSWLNSTLTFVCRWNEWSFTLDKSRFCLYSQIFLASFQSFGLIGLYRIASVVDAHQVSSFGNQIPWFQVHSWRSRKVLISVFRFICTELINHILWEKLAFLCLPLLKDLYNYVFSFSFPLWVCIYTLSLAIGRSQRWKSLDTYFNGSVETLLVGYVQNSFVLEFLWHVLGK